MRGFLPQVFSSEGQHTLNLGCGIGFMSVLLRNHYRAVAGIDIAEPSVAFNVDQPSPQVGEGLLAKVGIGSVNLLTVETPTFLAENRETWDLIFSHFVFEHIEDLESTRSRIVDALKPGGYSLNVVPNTHDTVNQLLLTTMRPLRENLRTAWRLRRTNRRHERSDLRRHGLLFAPITHSEFIDSCSDQFAVNSLERFLFPLLMTGMRLIDVKPLREHSSAILCRKE